MTRLIRGSVLLAACVGIWACGTDSTSSEAGVPFKIRALPEIVFVKTDSSQLIGFELVDELDGQIPTTWTISNPSSHFTVALDSSYRVVYNSDGTLTLPDSQTQVRATITGAQLGISTFTVSAGGKSLDVTVNVVPGTLYATFSPSNPAPGDVVTMTMPPSLRLTPASKISFPVITKSSGDTSSVRNLVIAADSMSATFIAAPVVDTTARVTGVYNVEFPTVTPVTLTTQTKVTGTMSGTFDGKLPATLSPASDPMNVNSTGSLTVTLASGYAFKCTPDCSAPANVNSAFTFPTQTAPNLAGISADSAVATLAVGPNVSTQLQATRVMFKGAPNFEYTLVSDEKVYTTVVNSVPVTLTPANPQVGDTVTIQAGAGYAFGPGAQVSWPLGSTAIIADTTWTTNSTKIRVLPMPGSAGLPTITKVVVLASPAFQLTLPATAGTPLTMQNTSIYDGLDDPNTATLLTLPPVGTDTLLFYDLLPAPGIDKFYHITPGAAVTLSTQLDWGNTADVDLLNCTGSPAGSPGCAGYFGGFAGATGARPENMNNVAYPAGSYYIWANLYAGTNPPWIKVRIIRVN